MFTEEETRSLFNKQNEALGPDKSLPFTFENLSAWYKGYITDDGKSLYNPWSIGLALSKEKLGPYWVDSGYDNAAGKRIHHMLRHEPKFREDVAALLEGRHIAVHIVDSMSCQVVSDMSMSQLWTLMYYAGYVTTLGVEEFRSQSSKSDSDTGGDAGGDKIIDENSEGDTDTSDDIDSEGRSMDVRIPNYEIRSEFRSWFRVIRKSFPPT